MVLVVVVSLELPLRQSDCIVLVVVANQVLVMRVACGVFDTGVSHRLDGIRISQARMASTFEVMDQRDAALEKLQGALAIYIANEGEFPRFVVIPEYF